MPITFDCSCGAKLTVESSQQGRKAFCPQCRNSVSIPESLLAKNRTPKPPDNSYEGEIFEPPHLERISGKDNQDRWKFICFCGKRILVPLHSEVPIGRCPKCGRRMRLPGYRPKGKESGRAAQPPSPAAPASPASPAISPSVAASGEKAVPKPVTAGLAETLSDVDPLALQTESDSAGPPDREDEIGTIVMEPIDPEKLRHEYAVNKEAAIGTADRLRAHKISVALSSGPGLVSAWPLAGRWPRALAGFIDLTFCVLAAVIIVGLSRLGVLPESCRNPIVALTAFLMAGFLNDIFLQLFGGTLGKRLVVLVIRKRNGKHLGVPWLALRGILKWLLFPGWIWCLIDPAERTWHDLICGTLVLKGRLRN